MLLLRCEVAVGTTLFYLCGHNATHLRKFVNYRHPGPRRMWKVGSELQSTTLDPADPRDPGDPRMNLKSCNFVAQGSKNEPDVALVLFFLLLF